MSWSASGAHKAADVPQTLGGTLTRPATTREGTHRGISAGILVAEKTPASKVPQINPSRLNVIEVPDRTSHLLKPLRIEQRPTFSIRNFRAPPPSPIGRGARGGASQPT